MSTMRIAMHDFARVAEDALRAFREATDEQGRRMLACADEDTLCDGLKALFEKLAHGAGDDIIIEGYGQLTAPSVFEVILSPEYNLDMVQRAQSLLAHAAAVEAAGGHDAYIEKLLAAYPETDHGH
jgi:hypothetical protein